MNVLVIGANGKVGSHVVHKLKEAGHAPVAMLRKEEQAEQFAKEHVKTVLADLEGDFHKAFNDVDAVVFAAGSGPNTGADKTIIIDQEGAIESVDLARKHGVKRFVLLSSMGADNPKAADQIKHYLYAKHRADQHLQDSGLNYKILRPGALTNDQGTGKVNLHEGKPEKGSIPRDDVAEVLAELVMTPSDENKIFNVIEGDQSIKDVFND